MGPNKEEETLGEKKEGLEDKKETQEEKLKEKEALEGPNKTLKEEIFEEGETTTTLVVNFAWVEPTRERKITTSSILQRRKKRDKRRHKTKKRGPKNRKPQEEVLRLRGGAGEGEDEPQDFFPLPPAASLPAPVKQVIATVRDTFSTTDKDDFLKQVRTLCKSRDLPEPPNDLGSVLKILGLPLEIQETCNTGDCGPMAAVKQLRLDSSDLTAKEREIVNLDVGERQNALRTWVKDKMTLSAEPWVLQYKDLWNGVDWNEVDCLPGGTKWTSWEHLWEGMGTPTIFVEEPFFTALAKLTERDIHIFSKTSSPFKPATTFYGHRYEDNTLSLKRPLLIGYNHSSRHYVSLKPMNFVLPTIFTIMRGFFKKKKKEEDEHERRLAEAREREKEERYIF